MKIYFRTSNDCPFNEDNWLIDIHFKESVYCIKLHKEMSEDQVMKYIKPLFDLLSEYKKSKIN